MSLKRDENNFMFHCLYESAQVIETSTTQKNLRISFNMYRKRERERIYVNLTLSSLKRNTGFKEFQGNLQ